MRQSQAKASSRPARLDSRTDMVSDWHILGPIQRHICKERFAEREECAQLCEKNGAPRIAKLIRQGNRHCGFCRGIRAGSRGR